MGTSQSGAVPPGSAHGPLTMRQGLWSYVTITTGPEEGVAEHCCSFRVPSPFVKVYLAAAPHSPTASFPPVQIRLKGEKQEQLLKMVVDARIIKH